MIFRIYNELIRRMHYYGAPSLESLPSDLFNSNEIIKSNKLNIKELDALYNEYVNQVSSANMAASIELSTSILSICRLLRPKRVVDLGSGFTSLVLRKYSNEFGAVVYSVDDDVKWLAKTGDYLKNKSFDCINLSNLDDFISSKEKDFELVVLDLNYVEIRKNYINLAIDIASKNSIIIFDDVHKLPYFKEVKRILKERKMKWAIAKELSLDKFNRYSLIAIK